MRRAAVAARCSRSRSACAARRRRSRRPSAARWRSRPRWRSRCATASTGFYLRLAHRRFDTLETYNDFIMRDHFASLDLFFDYYADLAEDLAAPHFERSRPTGVEVLEFLFEDAQDRTGARALRGDDGRPLRPGSVELVRTDRWELADGTWWVRPGKRLTGSAKLFAVPGVTFVHRKGNDSPRERRPAGITRDFGAFR